MVIRATKLRVDQAAGDRAGEVSFEVAAGEVRALVGGSDATFDAVMKGLWAQRAAAKGGRGESGRRDAVGYVSGEGGERYEGLQVERMLGYAAELGLRTEPVEVRGERVEAMIATLGLSEVRTRRLRELDGLARWKVEVGECALLGARDWVVKIEGDEVARRAKLKVMREVILASGAALVISSSAVGLEDVEQVTTPAGAVLEVAR
ncbi:hypothetical protein FRC98_13340 [Lujinxingia vulgaris]|uniref:Uncharacterized protein n=1 Tax=Lujinxingia vulgaris TaxID=2600176 RepID=A0A5C6X2X5_9DELT|nr:hypothetical protein [Lujinxingia vulgaris]TXD36104.1 hypothetical protein FRC98_13340 [Lujinxingia vulgaris]